MQHALKAPGADPVVSFSRLPLLFLVALLVLSLAAAGLHGVVLEPAQAVFLVVIALLLTVIRVQSVQRRRLQGRLQEMAVRDPLTGLLNSAGFAERADYLLAMHQRADLTLVAVCVRLGGLQGLAARYGQPAADAALRKLAEIARTRVRETDLVGRVAGDELALILVDAEPAQAAEAVERLAEEFRGWCQARGWALDISTGLVPVAAQHWRCDQLLSRGEQVLRKRAAQSMLNVGAAAG